MSLAQRLQRAWWRGSLLSDLLLPLAWTYAALDGTRRVLYRLGVWQSRRPGVPVLVVGNLVVGGAGKTPAVLAIVDLLRRRGLHPGIVSRGHGRRDGSPLDVTSDTSASACGDEPLLLRLRSGAPVCVGRDRVAAAALLRARHPATDVIVADDGLQHLRLHRDLQVIVFDDRGTGNGRLLPAGPLRERLPAQVQPGTLVLYTAGVRSTALPGHLGRRSLAGVVDLAGWWRGERAAMSALEALRGRPVIAAAGIARPERFFEMLRDAGLQCTELPLPDHHDFAVLPWPSDASDVVVTEKDAVKLRPGSAARPRIWVATLDFVPAPSFESALGTLLTDALAR